MPVDDMPMQLHWSSRSMNRCQADDDGYCEHAKCPQLRDGEPKRSGRHCPLDVDAEE